MRTTEEVIVIRKAVVEEALKVLNERLLTSSKEGKSIVEPTVNLVKIKMLQSILYTTGDIEVENLAGFPNAKD